MVCLVLWLLQLKKIAHVNQVVCSSEGKANTLNTQINSYLEEVHLQNGSSPTIPARTGIWKCWSFRRGENRSTRIEASRKKGENQIWRRRQDLNPGHFLRCLTRLWREFQSQLDALQFLTH